MLTRKELEELLDEVDAQLHIAEEHVIHLNYEREQLEEELEQLEVD